MRAIELGRWAAVALLGAAMLVTGGCLGGSRNFVPGGSAGTASGALAAGTARGDIGPRIGNLAPDFTLKALDGSTVRLSDLRGKPVLLNFWATWCPPCRQEMPDLEKAYQKYRDQGFVFLGVDQGEDGATVQRFVQQNGFSWTFLLDSDGRVGGSYQVSAIPTTFFIDRDGIVRDFQVGAISPATLESKLAKIK